MSQLDLDKMKSDPAVLRLYAQRMKLRREGRELVGLCPFHGEKTPSFKIYEKDGVHLYKCFGCGRGGNIFQFIENFDKIPMKSAINVVREFLGEKEQRAQDKERVDNTFKAFGSDDRQLTTYPLEKYSVYERALEKSEAARDWLKNRGIDYETAKRLHVGFRQDVGKIATEKNHDIADKGWLAFPRIENDVVVGVHYRSIERKAFCRQPNMKTALFNTETIDPLDSVYVVEGEIDVLSLEQAGFHAVSVPNSTTKITPEMKDQLQEADRIILAGDTDGVGSDAMIALWKELKDRTFLLKWPVDSKDANDLHKSVNWDTEAFKLMVNNLTITAASIPMPGVYSLPETMMSTTRTNLSDHPRRLHFPWPSVDKMAILLPGSVMNVFATNTKMGKTAFVMNLTMYNAQKYDEVILNYQCELSPDEFSNITAAYTLRKDRNHLSKEDNERAGRFLLHSNVKYYVGSDPTLTRVTPVLDLIEAAIKRLGATIVVLDHIHFIVRNEENPVQAMENAMQRIKNMAKMYGVKFIVVGQPRKVNSQNKGKVVHIGDWKGAESGTSDADAIFAIHREYIKIKDPNNPPKDDYDPKTEIHLLGARSKGDGSTFCILMFHGDLAAFYEETKIEPPPGVQQNITTARQNVV